jgi:hypothetical protein
MICKYLKIFFFMCILTAAMALVPAAAATTAALVGDPLLEPPETETVSHAWMRVARKGFGNPSVKQIFALAVHKDELYAVASSETSNIDLWKSSDGFKWTKINQQGKDNLSANIPNNNQLVVNTLYSFDGQLYLGAQTGRLWRSPDGVTWERVTSNGIGGGSIMVMYEYGNYLYVSTYKRLSRSPTGNPAIPDYSDWELVYSIPIDREPEKFNGIWSLIDYNGALYGGGEASSGNVVIFSNKGGSWGVTATLSDPDGGPINTEIGGFAKFNGALYTGTRNDVGGAQIWKLSGFPGTWTKVIGGGIDDLNNQKAEAFIVYNDELYVVMNNEVTGLKIYSSPDGEVWKKVGDSTQFPELITLTHWNNAVVIFKDRLFVGMRNSITGGEVWAFPGVPGYLPNIMK